MKQMVHHALIFILALFLVGCNSPKNKNNDKVLARVYDKTLYQSQFSGIVPSGLSAEDSTLIIRDHVDKWVRNQLLVHLAEINLTEEDKNVEQQINDYRTSLLIFKYEQNYIKEKLDTLITEQQIEKYYSDYSSNFLLNNHLIKGRYIRVSRSAPELWRVRRLYKSDDEADMMELESYCYENSANYSYFEEQWIVLDKVLDQMPDIYMKPENLLKYRKNFEVRDSMDYHFLKISDFRLESDIAPLDFIKEDIRSILLNKRKLQLIQELEASIYNDALNRENFTVY